MERKPNLRYSSKYSVMIDLNDNVVYNAKKEFYGKKINLHKFKGGYYTNSYQKNMTLHRIVCDACVLNPRPDIFDVVDHINGDTSDNTPGNLRWVNHHLNVNWRPNMGKFGPPGVELSKFCTKKGWVARYTFRKHNCVLFSSKNVEKVIDFAREFHINHFTKLYEAYLNSPVPGTEEWFEYWRNLVVCKKAVLFRKDIKNLRKFIVSHKLFKKLTGENGNGNSERAPQTTEISL